MRYSILGFNQEKLLQYDLSMNEVLLLNYIYEAQASPTMSHIIRDNQCYTWLSHDKIQEDLPVLNISKDRLKKLIKNIVDEGLIISYQELNGPTHGSKAYYGITEACEDLRYYNQDRGVENNPSWGVENNPSYNKLSDNKNNKTLSKDNVSGNPLFATKKKPNLYEKCIALITDFTEDAVLQDYLTQFFKVCSENAREAGTPFYTNTFKGKLNKLKQLSDDNYTQRQIVLQTLDNGWNSFYELKQEKVSKKQVSSDMGFETKRNRRRLSEGNNGKAEKF